MHLFNLPQPASEVYAFDVSDVVITRKSMKIPLVEDDDIMLAWLSKELEARGHEVMTATGGREALIIYRAERTLTWFSQITSSYQTPEIRTGWSSSVRSKPLTRNST
jgi:hypothetical protein